MWAWLKPAMGPAVDNVHWWNEHPANSNYFVARPPRHLCYAQFPTWSDSWNPCVQGGLAAFMPVVMRFVYTLLISACKRQHEYEMADALKVLLLHNGTDVHKTFINLFIIPESCYCIVSRSIYPSSYLSIYLSIYLSMYLSLYLSIYLSIYLS